MHRAESLCRGGSHAQEQRLALQVFPPSSGLILVIPTSSVTVEHWHRQTHRFWSLKVLRSCTSRNASDIALSSARSEEVRRSGPLRSFKAASLQSQTCCWSAMWLLRGGRWACGDERAAVCRSSCNGVFTPGERGSFCEDLKIDGGGKGITPGERGSFCEDLKIDGGGEGDHAGGEGKFL